MPTLPDPPVFHGHPKKDNLPVFLHDLKMWFRSVQGISSSMSKERVSGLLERAFPFQSQAHDWYESEKEELLAQVSAAETDQLDALHRSVSTALGKEFEHILGDKEQELWAMVLKPSDNLADFASRYYRLAKETRVDTGKAVRRLKVAVQRCAPTLASQIDVEMLQLGNEVSLDKVFYMLRGCQGFRPWTSRVEPHLTLAGVQGRLNHKRYGTLIAPAFCLDMSTTPCMSAKP